MLMGGVSEIMNCVWNAIWDMNALEATTIDIIALWTDGRFYFTDHVIRLAPWSLFDSRLRLTEKQLLENKPRCIEVTSLIC